MKGKIFLILLVIGAVWLACEKDNLLFTSGTQLFKAKSLNDGRFDVVYLGCGYVGNGANTLWAKNLDSAKFAFRQTFFQHDSITRFWSKKLNGKNPLQCNDRAIGQGNVETIVCDPQRTVDAALLAVPPNVQIDLIIILANGFGHESHEGSVIVAVGLGAQTPAPTCTFVQAAFWYKQTHGVGHYFGLSHDNSYGNRMNDCVNGGCACYYPFSTAQYDTISWHFQ